MPAYVIVDLEIRDPAGYEAYRVAAPATVSAHGGRYLARGGETEVLEGDWSPRRLVVLEFPDMESFRAWWTSPEYVRIRPIRERTTRSRLIVTQGLEQQPH